MKRFTIEIAKPPWDDVPYEVAIFDGNSITVVPVRHGMTVFMTVVDALLEHFEECNSDLLEQI